MITAMITAITKDIVAVFDKPMGTKTGVKIAKGVKFQASSKQGLWLIIPGGAVSMGSRGQYIDILDYGTNPPPPPPPPTDRLPVIPYQLGIIKQSSTPTERSFDPQSRPLMDHPIGTVKGDTYVVPFEWIAYMKKLMTLQAWNWWKRPNTLMTNHPHKYDGTPPSSNDECRFENIMLPCNFIAFDQMTTLYGRVAGMMNSHDTNLLDPLRDNWFYKPHQYWKATMHNNAGVVRKVGSGFDVYTPVIRQQPEQWALLEHVELFPTLPMTVTYAGKQYLIDGYSLKGTNVYGHAEALDVPLRVVDNTGLNHPCPEWRLVEKPVPQEVRPEWI